MLLHSEGVQKGKLPQCEASSLSQEGDLWQMIQSEEQTGMLNFGTKF